MLSYISPIVQSTADNSEDDTTLLAPSTTGALTESRVQHIKEHYDAAFTFQLREKTRSIV